MERNRCPATELEDSCVLTKLTDPLGMQRTLLGTGGGTLWEDSSFGFATISEVGWELPSRANRRRRSLVVIMNGTTLCSLGTVRDLHASQDEPGLPGILGITVHFWHSSRCKMLREMWKGDAGSVVQRARSQLVLSPALFTRWAVACYQTGRQWKCQVHRLCSTVPAVIFEPRTTRLADELALGVGDTSLVVTCASVTGGPAFLGRAGLVRVRKTVPSSWLLGDSARKTLIAERIKVRFFVSTSSMC